jgi:aspartyl-tRNA(Asn)/glutamyl-tRNA(Gln) amidotransferase subunit A
VSAAEGSSDIAIGSDTGGSVRIPASLNGVVGFKPTASRVPLDGAFPLSQTLDSIGPLARTVAQCAAADAVMAGEEAKLAAVPLSGLRVGIPRGRLLDDLEPDVATAFERSLSLLEAAGARIFDHPIDDLVAAMAKATAPGSIASIEGAALHADWLTSDTSAVDPRVSGPLGRRLSVPAHIYIRMLRQRRELAAAMDMRLALVDVLALPTTPMVAPPAARLMDDAALCERTEGLLLRNPQVANQFDLTAISLPMPAMELPAGIMLIARHGDDRRLLAIAAAVESAFLRIA